MLRQIMPNDGRRKCMCAPRKLRRSDVVACRHQVVVAITSFWAAPPIIARVPAATAGDPNATAAPHPEQPSNSAEKQTRPGLRPGPGPLRGARLRRIARSAPSARCAERAFGASAGRSLEPIPSIHLQQLRLQIRTLRQLRMHRMIRPRPRRRQNAPATPRPVQRLRNHPGKRLQRRVVAA